MINFNEVAIVHTIIIVAFLGQQDLLNCVYPTYSNNKYVHQIIITAIEFSLGGSSPYISTDKTNNIHKNTHI